MSKAKARLHYDGWLALPAAMRQKLGLASGHQLELELVAGTIVLRPERSAAGAADAGDPAPAEPVSPAVLPAPEAEPTQAAAPSEPVKRGPGRPRKIPVAASTPPAAKSGPGRPRKALVAALPPALKARGRRAAVTAE